MTYTPGVSKFNTFGTTPTTISRTNLPRTDDFLYNFNGEMVQSETVHYTEKDTENTAPKAGVDTATTPYGTAVTVDVLANDTDVDGDSLKIVDVISQV